MREHIVIERLQKNDIEATKSLIREYIAWMNIDMSFQDIEEELARFPRKYEAPTGAFLVAKDGDTVVGCVGFKRIGDGICEMKRLFVKDAYRGRGIGRALIERIIREAEEYRYSKMRLDTLKRMESAVRLYSAFSFGEIGQYVVNPIEDALFMEKELNPRNP